MHDHAREKMLVLQIKFEPSSMLHGSTLCAECSINWLYCILARTLFVPVSKEDLGSANTKTQEPGAKNPNINVQEPKYFWK